MEEQMEYDVTFFQQAFKKHREEFLQDYKDLLRFQTISTDAKYETELAKARVFLIDYFKNIQFSVEEWETDGHAAIFAQNLSAGKDKPTVLLYGHYDVQPVDPIDEWLSDPFEPIEKNGKIYARGALDNKGQLALMLSALKFMMTEFGELGVNVKMIIEGEEEMGSPNTIAILESRKEALKCDALLVVDLDLVSEDVPCITLGLRGLCALNVECIGSKIDLHSGMHGGMVFNPIHGLVELLSTLRDPKSGKILVEGFYEGVSEPSEKEKAMLDLQFDEKEYEKMFDAKAVGGEIAFPPAIRNWLRPTIEVNGIYGGYTGPGIKTVIPAKAYAKISCRLIDGQDPKKVQQQIQTHLEKHAPRGITVNVELQDAVEGVRANADAPILKTVSESLEEVFKNPCKYVMSGGTVGITKALQKASSGDVVMMGFGLPEDNIHAPNESFALSRFEKGFLTIVRILQKLGQKT
ncbi:MAG: N-formyl-4-amino-5-aminomethyl-2-methylpyrimidine deformylase [Chlamydiae bacterium]|nr:N-formyl-4-amino-5-aminomethyl-2-methylpyrimidine deformylase [Chlamydiota bacterium]